MSELKLSEKNSMMEETQMYASTPFVTMTIELHKKQRDPQTGKWYITLDGEKKEVVCPSVRFHANDLHTALNRIDLREIVEIHAKRPLYRHEYADVDKLPLED
jgi:hypothetical protein